MCDAVQLVESNLKVQKKKNFDGSNAFSGLVSLFNGISNFVGYLMPKLFSEKNTRGTV